MTTLARWIEVPAEAPETWAAFPWPEWIPEPTRKQIEDFWRENWGRGPRAWLRDHVVQGMPDTGERITTEDLCTLERDKEGRRPNITGRYIHAWNNVGRLLLDDGRVQFACAGYRPRSAPQACEGKDGG
jgi:hypothetical protein